MSTWQVTRGYDGYQAHGVVSIRQSKEFSKEKSSQVVVVQEVIAISPTNTQGNNK